MRPRKLVKVQVKDEDFLTESSSDDEDKGSILDSEVNKTHVRALADLISYCLFLAFLFCVVFLDPAEKHGAKVVRCMGQTLTGAWVKSIPELWTFLKSVDPAVQKQSYYNGEPIENKSTLAYDAFWLCDQNLVLGRIRLRQMRLKDENTCVLPKVFSSSFRECNTGAWVTGVVESGDSARGTHHKELASNGSYCCTANKPLFDSEYELHADGYPWWSKETKILYDTAGYSVTIPRESDASSVFLQNLESANWIDSKTRAVFVEYGVYNANVDHFAVARHAFEIVPSGLVLPTETFDSVPLLADVRIFMGDNPKPENIAQMFFEFTLYAMILGYFTRAADIATEAGSIYAYLMNPWNLCQILNVFTFTGIIIVRFIYVLRAANISYEVNTIGNNGQENIPDEDGIPDYEGYVRVNMTIQIWRVGRNLLAIGCFLNFALSFKYIRASPQLSQVTETVVTALPEMGRITFIFFIILLGFTLALKLIIGTAVDGYADLIDGIFSLLGMILGKFDKLDDMFQEDPVLLPIMFALIVFLLNFTGLTLLLSSISEAFGKVSEKQRKMPDTFARELQLAIQMIVRDAYWSVATPIAFILAERRMKRRLQKQRLDRQGNHPLGSKWNKSLKIHPIDLEQSTKQPQISHENSSRESSTNGISTKKIHKRQAKKAAEAENVVQRIARLKYRILAGLHVREEDVYTKDVIEKISYVTHRQAILQRRLRTLFDFIRDNKDALTAFDENESDSEEEDTLDFSRDARVISSMQPMSSARKSRTTLITIPM